MSFRIVVIALVLLSCSSKNTSTSSFGPQESVGSVPGKLREASGLVASRANPGYIWTLNDGGNPSEVYLLNDKADIVMTCKLKNITNRDWEEIVIGPGPIEGHNYLYVCDIGDNESVYPNKLLYRFEEPVFNNEEYVVPDIDTLVVLLPGGTRDTETMMVDPITNNFYIVSKREEAARLYEMRFPFVSDTLDVQELDTLSFKNIVAANISTNGEEILMKNYNHIYYWKRKPNEPIKEVLARQPIPIEYKPEPQGESIAWKLDGSGFYTLSEAEHGKGGKLYFYKRK